MSNAEQDTGQNKQEQEQNEWDSLAEPFDARKVENPTQDDLSYEAWLRSNANPDQLDADGNPTGAVTPEKPFDTKDIENPTQDDLSYEAWLKSNANPAFETDRDGNPNRAYEASKTEGEPAAAAEQESTAIAEEEDDGAELDPTKSRWSQMSEDDKYNLLHKYPRLEGEKTNEWGKRIEAAEGVRIFGLETKNEKTSEATESAENAEKPAPKEETAEQSDTEQAENAPIPAPEQAEGTPTSETAAEESLDEAESPAENESEEVEAEEPTSPEAEQGQEDAEKRKKELLIQLGGGKIASWVESDKKLTRGDLDNMDAEGLQQLVDEYDGLNVGEDIPESSEEGDASMLGAAMEAAPAQPAPEAVVGQTQAAEATEEAASTEGEVNTHEKTAETAETKTLSERIEKINTEIDTIREYRVQSSVWEHMSKLLADCSEGVKKSVEFARAKRGLERDEAMLRQHREELRRMPLFTLPWSEARTRKDNLKSIIKSAEASLAITRDRFSALESGLPESLTDEEQNYVDNFSMMDARMDRVNADLHIRAELGAIGMRKGWIKDQRVAMEKGQSGQNSPSNEKREAFIRKTQAEIDAIQKRIDDYQEAHPNFMLHPDLEYKNLSYDQIAGEGMDETPDVVIDDDAEDEADLDGEESAEA